MEGTVKWFNTRKGYGFIDGDDGETYFAHYTALPKGVYLNENDRVSFEDVDTERGKQARNINVTGKSEGAPSEEGSEDQEGSEEEPVEEGSEEEVQEEEEPKEE